MTISNAYKTAGVDIKAGADLVQRIAPFAKASARAGASAALGGFGAFFDPKAAGYKDPLLVATTDGVGTKVKIAIEFGLHDTIGTDLVAMSVNDLVVQGAEPLFFLDYFATGKLDVDVAARVVAGIAKACQEVNCALIGGETAEMPDLYAPGDYDLAGFALGAVERGQALTGADIKAGDAVIGLASSGVHSNGYSLVRHIVQQAGLSYKDPAPYAADISLAAALLIPTKLYVKPALALCRAGLVKGLAHITGGGLLENIPRILHGGLGVELDASTWEFLCVFRFLAKVGNLTTDDLARTFNCGLGMIAIVAADKTDQALQVLRDAGQDAAIVGEVTTKPGVVIKGWDAWLA